MTQINDHLWEGRYSPKVDGKRIAQNVYAPTEEECEQKLAELIKEMKKELEPLRAREKPAENENRPPEKQFRSIEFFLSVAVMWSKTI